MSPYSGIISPERRCHEKRLWHNSFRDIYLFLNFNSLFNNEIQRFGWAAAAPAPDSHLTQFLLVNNRGHVTRSTNQRPGPGGTDQRERRTGAEYLEPLRCGGMVNIIEADLERYPAQHLGARVQ